jgi:glycosyltransferase involved in cell wall biosynthesis
MVKVLHLGKYYPPAKGGMETVLEMLCTETSTSLDNCALVANDAFQLVEERHGSVRVVRVPALARIGAVSVCPTLPFRLAKEKADLIVIHEPNPMGLLAYFLARPSGRLIVWFHSEVIRPGWKYRTFYRPFLRYALDRADRIVVASPTLAASSAQLEHWQSKCVVIPYGIKGEAQPAPAAVAARAEAIRVEHARPIVLFVGRHVAYKGLSVFIDAMRDLSAVALLVGDGPERPRLERQAAALGLGERVKFLGEVDDLELAALYRACDVVVLPSITRQEAFGVVQIEAMARSKPVVSTDLGTGTAWVNQHGQTGLVVPPRDSRVLAGALRELLMQPSLRESFGAAGRRRWASLFTVDRMTQSTLALFEEVLRQKAGGRAA